MEELPANFQMEYHKGEITACRRNGKLVSGEKFHGYENIVEKHRESLENLGKDLCVGGVSTFKIYGEIYGGNVQREIFYHTHIDFSAFDIYCDGKFLDFDIFNQLCEKYNIPTAPLIFRGTFDKAVKIDPGQETKIGDENVATGKNRIMEGIIVRPVKEP